MAVINRFFKKLKTVSLKDYGHIFLFIAALIPSLFLRLSQKHMWLVCEYGKEARDNGYWFYKYVRENHPERNVVYAIDKSSDDYNKVKDLGKVIPYGGFIHWIYYLAAEVNISSHKGGKPNAAVCYLLEVYGILKNKRVFLQHGITKDRTDIFIYPNTKFRLFICGAKPEYDFITEEFGYPEGYVKYTGFARFDSLMDMPPQKKQILVAPTWRAWLRTGGSDPYKKNSNKHISESNYFKTWEKFLTSPALAELLDKNGYTLVFYPHRNVLDCFDDIHPASDRVIIADWQKYDLQVLMKESKLMITDYSSSVMDFAYMEKPVIYYQFDYDEFRSKHFEEGYYSYTRDGFGPVCYGEDELFSEISHAIDLDCTMKEPYTDRLNSFFVLRDKDNCKRIYEEICKI